MKKLLSVFLFFLSVNVYGNVLWVSERGDVVAETDGYRARFEYGVLVYFRNKHTQDIYTQRAMSANSFLGTLSNGRLKTWHTDPAVKIHSPLDAELIYRRGTDTLHLFIGIDPETSDLLIRQKGVSEGGGVVDMSWGFSNLSHEAVDVIAPVVGGQMITRNFEERSMRYVYPGRWEAQLLILQAQNGGAFIRSDDAAYRFKSFRYSRNRDGQGFAIDFGSEAFGPYRERSEMTTPTWRLNVYEGYWEVPARVYREWMHKTFQPPDRNIAWVEDIQCVISYTVFGHDGTDATILPVLNRLVDAEKTMIHIYGGTPKPEFSDEGVRQDFLIFLKEARRYGFKVMFHTAITLSPYDPLYPMFEQYQLIHPETGEKQGYRWNDPTYDTPGAYMNFAAQPYRQLLVSRFKRFYETYEGLIDAIHLDTSARIANADNAIIDGVTMAEGHILLHKELKEAIPGIALGGEGLNEVTFLHESFAQKWSISEFEKAHPISSFIFQPYTKFYGWNVPHPDYEPDKYFPETLREDDIWPDIFDEYEVWGVLPTIRIKGSVADLDPNHVVTHKLLAVVRARQNYIFGDVNSDGVVNVLDLVLVANGFDAVYNRAYDLNVDGAVNVLDLVLVANAF